jgi:hypothetical protein
MVSGPVLVPKTAPISPDEIQELFKATLDLHLS